MDTLRSTSEKNTQSNKNSRPYFLLAKLYFFIFKETVLISDYEKWMSDI